jgi:hypothetical protein
MKQYAGYLVSIKQTEMTQFMTRVELHEKPTFPFSKPDYEVLHKLMKDAGFSRTVTIGNTIHHLPTAEYLKEGNFTTDSVISDAQTAAKKTGFTSSIMTIKIAEWKVSGLIPDLAKSVWR